MRRGGLFCASKFLMRSSVCLLSQVCAKKTASRPKRPAKAIMAMVLVRTTDPCLTSRKKLAVLYWGDIGASEVLNW